MSNYLKLLRIDHWVKNVLILPGLFFAFLVIPVNSIDFFGLGMNLALGLISFCLASSANYCLNEYLDAESDLHHPRKNKRVSVNNKLKKSYVYFVYLVLVFLSLLISFLVDFANGITVIFYLVMAILYNVRPLRLKDRKILDVMTESINNPIRFVFGWQLWSNLTIPPISAVVAFWFIGAFLMGCKRLAEINELSDKVTMGELKAYRKSLASYNKLTLMMMILFLKII